MSHEINLKAAERKVFKSAFQDGLLEIMLGCIVLMFAIGPFLSPYLGDFWSSAVFLPFWAAVFALLWVVRRRVVRPRLGRVEFGAWRKARLLRFNVLMLVVNIVAFALGLLAASSFGLLPGWVHTVTFSLIILLGSCAAAWFLNFPALYLYGLLIALAFLVGEGLYLYLGIPHHGYPVTFGSTAGLLILVGLFKLLRLLRAYPCPTTGFPWRRRPMAEQQIGPAGIDALLNLDPIIHAPARLSVLTYLSVVESSDFVFLKNMTGLTWGNLSTHLSKLEEAGYVEIEKQFKDKKPHTMIRLTAEGQAAFQVYRQDIRRALDDLPPEGAATE